MDDVEQAMETYTRTLRNVPDPEDWPNWVKEVERSLIKGYWTGGAKYPGFAAGVFRKLMKEISGST